MPTPNEMTDDVLTLRDPSQPCEHTLDPLAMYDGAYFDDEGGYWRCGFGLCPGGRKLKGTVFETDRHWTVTADNIVSFQLGEDGIEPPWGWGGKMGNLPGLLKRVRVYVVEAIDADTQ